MVLRSLTLSAREFTQMQLSEIDVHDFCRIIWANFFRTSLIYSSFNGSTRFKIRFVYFYSSFYLFGCGFAIAIAFGSITEYNFKLLVLSALFYCFLSEKYYRLFWFLRHTFLLTNIGFCPFNIFIWRNVFKATKNLVEKLGSNLMVDYSISFCLASGWNISIKLTANNAKKKYFVGWNQLTVNV